MEQPSEEAQDSQDEVEKWVEEMWEEVARYPVKDPLRELGVDEERIAYLCNHNNVLRDLPNASAEDWELALATAAQISRYGYPDVDHAKFREENLEHIERLVLETEGDRPDVLLKAHRLRAYYEVHPRWGTYIYSRICKVAMVRADPQQTIQLLEDVQTLFHEDEYIESGMIASSIGEELIRLCGTVGEYGIALRRLLLLHDSLGYPVDISEWGYFIVNTFRDWLESLSKSGGIAEVKRLLDLINEVDDHIYENERGLYELLHKFIGAIATLEDESFTGIPEHIRERFKEKLAIIETHQYWAWFYGNALGKLLIQRPGLRQSLLVELEAGKWSEGWPAGSILFESPPDSWGEYQQEALKLYNAADIEYRYNGSYIEDTEIEDPLEHDTPSGERQPPHLSPQSDLYWIMRVGFADAHIESRADRPARLQEMADTP